MIIFNCVGCGNNANLVYNIVKNLGWVCFWQGHQILVVQISSIKDVTMLLDQLQDLRFVDIKMELLGL